MTSSRVTLVLFAIGLFVSIVLLINVNTGDIPELEFSILWLRQALGTFIASAAALVIFIACSERPAAAGCADACGRVPDGFAHCCCSLVTGDTTWADRPRSRRPQHFGAV